MGNFSFMCSITGEQIRDTEPQVVLYYIKNGVILEVMAGPYNGYGAVEADKQTVHKRLIDGQLVDVPPIQNVTYSGECWYHPWSVIVDDMCGPDQSSGIHAVKGPYDPAYRPTTKSEDDPNQGWAPEEWDYDEEDYDEE
jgi:hypothetical protein